MPSPKTLVNQLNTTNSKKFTATMNKFKDTVYIEYNTFDEYHTMAGVVQFSNDGTYYVFPGIAELNFAAQKLIIDYLANSKQSDWFADKSLPTKYENEGYFG